MTKHKVIIEDMVSQVCQEHTCDPMGGEARRLLQDKGCMRYDETLSQKKKPQLDKTGIFGQDGGLEAEFV